MNFSFEESLFRILDERKRIHYNIFVDDWELFYIHFLRENWVGATIQNEVNGHPRRHEETPLLALTEKGLQ